MSTKQHEKFLELLVLLQQHVLSGQKINMVQLEYLAIHGEVPTRVIMPAHDKTLIPFDSPREISGINVSFVQVNASVLDGKELMTILKQDFLPLPMLSDEIINGFDDYAKEKLLPNAIKDRGDSKTRSKEPHVFIICEDDQDEDFPVVLFKYYKSRRGRAEGFRRFKIGRFNRRNVPRYFPEKAIIFVAGKRQM